MMVTWNQPLAWITVGAHRNVYSTKLNQDATKPSRSSSREKQLDVVVVGKSADILYLFGEPKLLIINPPCSQSLILPPMSSKNTSMCRSVTFHPSMMVHVASTKHSISSVTFFLNNSTTCCSVSQSKWTHSSLSQPTTDTSLSFNLTGRLS